MLWMWSLGVSSYSLIGMSCVDAKRVVAYSTAWHVSVLSILVGTSTLVCIYHLVGHALFKSGLFMLMGLLLHATGLQDSRSIPSIAVTGAVPSMLGAYMLQSIGWLYTPTWTTKKIMGDAVTSLGTE